MYCRTNVIRLSKGLYKLLLSVELSDFQTIETLRGKVILLGIQDVFILRFFLSAWIDECPAVVLVEPAVNK